MMSGEDFTETTRPLAGKRVMVTRERSQAKEMVEKIEALGGEAYAFPLLKMIPPQDSTKLDAAIHELASYDWVIFTSVNGVRYFFARMDQLGVPAARITGQLAAVGPKTAAALEKRGLQVAVIPGEYVAEGLLTSLGNQLHAGQRVLLPRADIARKVLPQELLAMGMDVTEVDVYHTVIDAEQAPEAVGRIQKGEIDVILFTSSSTVTHFVQAMAPYATLGWLAQVKIACIGPITAETAQRLGLIVDVVAQEYTVDGLLEAVTKNMGGEHA
ncbi:MAG TPA: uroporphyrinogen-III synthase [Brevibacillus sp.]|nr:uroporphyrinogen-III synthase [Brevibacillus sp.]